MLTETYITYIVLVLLITVLVARTLSKNGAAFLVDGFGGNEKLAQSINHLLVVGFYLINLGFALLQINSTKQIETIEKAIVFVSVKIGFVLVVVGVMHFFNLFLISRFKASQLKKQVSVHQEQMQVS